MTEVMTFGGNAAQKASLVRFAASLSGAIQRVEWHNGREKINWSEKTHCGAEYVCQKGKDCDHRFYSDEIGVPVAVAYAEHAIFMELSGERAGLWPRDFLNAIPVGVNLEAAQVWKKLALYVLADKQHGLITFAQNGEQFAAVNRVIALFEQDSEDAKAWEDAENSARRTYHKNTYQNSRMQPDEARLYAGYQACHSASLFAACFKEPRHATEAISWSAWCARYLTYSNELSGRRDPQDDVPVVNGLVNVGSSLYAFGEWMRMADAADSKGELARFEQYNRISRKFLELLKAASGEKNLWQRFAGSVRARLAA